MMEKLQQTKCLMWFTCCQHCTDFSSRIRNEHQLHRVLHKLDDYISLWNWLSSPLVREHYTSSLHRVNKIQFVLPEKPLFNKGMSNKQLFSLSWKVFHLMETKDILKSWTSAFEEFCVEAGSCASDKKINLGPSCVKDVKLTTAGPVLSSKIFSQNIQLNIAFNNKVAQRRKDIILHFVY